MCAWKLIINDLESKKRLGLWMGYWRGLFFSLYNEGDFDYCSVFNDLVVYDFCFAAF